MKFTFAQLDSYKAFIRKLNVALQGYTTELWNSKIEKYSSDEMKKEKVKSNFRYT